MARAKQTSRKTKGGKAPRGRARSERREVFHYRIKDTPILQESDLEKYQQLAAEEHALRQQDALRRYENELRHHQASYESYLKILERQWLVFKAGEDDTAIKACDFGEEEGEIKDDSEDSESEESVEIVELC